MQHTIFKYAVPFSDNSTIQMARGAEILSAGTQDPGWGIGVYVWAKVDSREGVMVPRRFYIHGTGHSILNPRAKFIGTVFDRELVWHVFDGGEV